MTYLVTGRHSYVYLKAYSYNVQVDEEMLAYSSMEYVGELYRIKVSCAEDETNYIFVVWGTTNVTERKHLVICVFTILSILTLCSGLHTYYYHFLGGGLRGYKPLTFLSIAL